MSTRSNSSASCKKTKKRKADQNQKTLGAAWGSNSRSSSRSAFQSSPFPDFGSYMVLKNQKLHQQFDSEASSSSISGSSSSKPVFQGVSIFVDGYTVPSSQELRGYMLKYGGRFENYFSRHRVTHIICSNLPDSKIKNLRSFSCGLPVVKPNWVLDSVAANKLLNWVPYQLYQLGSVTSNQPKLSAFFSLKKTEVLDDSGERSCSNATSRTSDSSSSSDMIDVDNFAGECKAKEREGTGDLVSDHTLLNCNAESYGEETESLQCKNQEKVDNNTAMNERNSGFLHQSTAVQASTSPPDGFGDNQSAELSSSSRRPPISGHSTLSDANFVENFFKFSRLHFIGTWRSRYRKRYPTYSGVVRDPRSSGNLADADSQENIVIHIDMDSFFVSVITRNQPELKDKPVAVCHSDNPRGTSEVSSANYPARDYGVKAGMFVRDAKALCPHLVTVPYDFKAYEEVADQFYDTLHKHGSKVQAVSCDEAFLDVTDSGVEDPQLLALDIRKEIYAITGCSASAGIASNMLLARIATRIAKPNGQFYISSDKVDECLQDLPVKALPGVGYVLQEKLKSRQIKTCAELRLLSKESLQKDFGMKTGDMLWNFCRGIDYRSVNTIQETKSIGADVNWGVRFKNMNDTKQFMSTLCKEVSLRLQGCGVMGRTFTLKIKKRKAGAGEPVKYMGCGDCENLSRSITLPLATDDGDVLERISAQLFGHFHIDPKDIRGMGLQASKLKSVEINERGREKNIRSWLVSSSAKTGCCDYGEKDTEPTTGEARLISSATLPSLEDLDIGVIESLPPDILAEIDQLYGGKLMKMTSNKAEKLRFDKQLMDSKSFDDKNTINEEDSCSNHMVLPDKAEESPTRNVVTRDFFPSSIKDEREQVSVAGASEFVSPSEATEPKSLMPSSLSQLDPSVLQHLPEEVKADLLEYLPAHRRHGMVPDDVSLDCDGKQIESGEPSSSQNLWFGNPPRWVDDFSLLSSPLLNMLAIFFRKRGNACPLSTIFRQIMAEFNFLLDIGSNAQDDSVSCLCELIKQYIDIKVGSDIEEIYVCSGILRRLSLRSKIFSEVYDSILPHLQVSISEHYGGTLNVPFML